MVQGAAGLDSAGTTPTYGASGGAASAHAGGGAAAEGGLGGLGGSAGAESVSSKCPLSRIPIVKDVMGGLLYLAPPAKFRNRPPPLKGLKLECPAAIVKMRAAFAATPPIQALRPQVRKIGRSPPADSGRISIFRAHWCGAAACTRTPPLCACAAHAPIHLPCEPPSTLALRVGRGW